MASKIFLSSNPRFSTSNQWFTDEPAESVCEYVSLHLSKLLNYSTYGKNEQNTKWEWQLWSCAIYITQQSGGEHNVNTMPLCHQGITVPPWRAHFLQCLPQRRSRKTVCARQNPHVKQYVQHPLTKHTANGI